MFTVKSQARFSRRQVLSGAAVTVGLAIVPILQACAPAAAPTAIPVPPPTEVPKPPAAPTPTTAAAAAAPTATTAAKPTEAPKPTTAPTQAAVATAAKPASTKPVTILMWHWKFGQPSFKAWSDWLKTEYAKTHPNVTLQYFQPADIAQAVKVGIAGGGDVADLVGLGGDPWELEVAKAGYWINFKSPIETDPEWKDWTKGWAAVPKQQITYQDQIYVAPLTNGPNFIYYWKDLFQQAGAEPPKTIDELYTLPAKFKAIGVDTMVSGLDSTSAWQYNVWFWQLAGDINYDWAAKRQDGNCSGAYAGDPVARQALEILLNLYKTGVLRKQTPQEKYDPDAKQAFNQRKAAMFYTAGVWINGGLGDSLKNVGAMYFPTLKAGDKYTYMGSDDVAVGALQASPGQKDTDHRREVLDFVKFLTSPDSQKKLWDAGLMPLYPGAIGSETTPAQKITADQIRMCNAPEARVLYYSTLVPELSEAIGVSSLGLLINAKTPDQVLADLNDACAKANQKQ